MFSVFYILHLNVSQFEYFVASLVLKKLYEYILLILCVRCGGLRVSALDFGLSGKGSGPAWNISLLCYWTRY